MSNNSGNFLFIPPDAVERLVEQKEVEKRDDFEIIDVSSRGDHAYFSPFTTIPENTPELDVPGMRGEKSLSVEGIWQGLKYIDGEIDTSYFRLSEGIKKRKYSPYPETTFQYEGKPIGLIDARKQIYVPAYTQLFERNIPSRVKDNLVDMVEDGKSVFFYDVDKNPDINNPNESFSHAALLTKLLTHYRRETR